MVGQIPFSACATTHSWTLGKIENYTVFLWMKCFVEETDQMFQLTFFFLTKEVGVRITITINFKNIVNLLSRCCWYEKQMILKWDIAKVYTRISKKEKCWLEYYKKMWCETSFRFRVTNICKMPSHSSFHFSLLTLATRWKSYFSFNS